MIFHSIFSMYFSDCLIFSHSRTTNIDDEHIEKFVEISVIDESIIPDNIVQLRRSFGAIYEGEDNEYIIREREIFLRAALQLLDQKPILSSDAAPELSSSQGEHKNFSFMSFPVSGNC